MKQANKIIDNTNVLMSSVVLSKALGRGVGSQFICQIQYWASKGLGKVIDGKVWIYNSAEIWAKQLGVTAKQVRNLIKKFCNMGILHVKKLNKSKWDHTCSVAIDHEKLKEKIGQNIFTAHVEKTSTSMDKKVPDLNTKNNNKEEYKSEKTIPPLCHDLPPATQQVNVVKNNIEEDKNESSPLKTPCQNPKIAQQMIDLWNKRFEKSQTQLDKNLSRYLVAAFKNKFKSNMEEWDLYLKRIASSPYLTGKTFTLRLSWVLKYETIDVIEKKGWGVKDVERPINHDALETEFDTHLKTLSEKDFLKTLRQKIAKVIGIPAYLSWFTKGSFVEEQDYIHFQGSTAFVTDYIATHYRHLYATAKQVIKSE